MLRKLFIISFILFTHLLEGKSEKPNILFFLVDDLGWYDVGYQGSKFYETPNIDMLSE